MKTNRRPASNGKAPEKAGENKISVRRLSSIFFCIVIFAAGLFLLSYRENLLLDEEICLFALTVIFLAVFFLTMRHERLSDRLSFNGTSYRKFIVVFAVCFGLLMAGTYMKDFFFPILIVSFLLTSVMDGKLSIAMSVYFACVFSIAEGAGIYMLLCYVVLGCLGALISDYFKDERLSVFTGLIVFCIAIFVPAVFQYLSYQELSTAFLKDAFASGLVSALTAWILFPILVKFDRREPSSVYETLLDPDYSLAQDIRRYSLAEYEHAKRVSLASGACARLVGAKVLTASCGGLYYRLGVMAGEPVVKNGVRQAVDNCFPTDVIRILSEYQALEQKPSTVESAIVHMTDAIITKLEVLDSDTFTTDWNQSMVIYQTLNELSSKGVYDESGMAINQFLRIRDFLAEKDLLASTSLN